MFGIDVSYWQDENKIDYATVAATNEFVIVKAAGAEDPAPAGVLNSLKRIYGPALRHTEHVKRARAAGMRVGHYFFNNGLVNVQAQAEKFIAVLQASIRPGDIVALDIEPNGPTCPEFTPAQALEFVNRVETTFGIKTFLYMNRATMNGQDWSALVRAGHPLWLATLSGKAVADSTPIKHWADDSISQFEIATIPGYPAGIDRNYSTIGALDKYGYRGA